jgi:hypothetical protein
VPVLGLDAKRNIVVLGAGLAQGLRAGTELVRPGNSEVRFRVLDTGLGITQSRAEFLGGPVRESAPVTGELLNVDLWPLNDSYPLRVWLPSPATSGHETESPLVGSEIRPPRDLIDALRRSLSRDPRVALVEDRVSADLELVATVADHACAATGVKRSGGLSYRWRTVDREPLLGFLPSQSDAWIEAELNGTAALAESLAWAAQNLAKTVAWARLSTLGSESMPLAIGWRDSKTKKPVESDALRVGTTYDIVFTDDPGAMPQASRRHHRYVMALLSNGECRLLYPDRVADAAPTSGSAGLLPGATEVAKADVQVSQPGAGRMVLITSSDAIVETWLFRCDAFRTGESENGTCRVARGERQRGNVEPAQRWSVRQFPVRAACPPDAKELLPAMRKACVSK